MTNLKSEYSPTLEDWAWASGLFEGEGSSHVDRAQPNKRTLSVAITDKDVLDRFAMVMGVGNVCGPYQHKQWKPVWRWNISRLDEVERICREMEPWLGERRRAKMSELGIL